MRSITILWGTLLGAVVLLVAVAGLVPFEGQAAASKSLLYGLAVVAGAEVALSWIIPEKNLARAYGALRDQVVEEAVVGERGAYREESAKRRVLHLGTAALQRVLVVYRVSMILGCSMNVAIAIFGVVLTQVGFPLLTAAPFFLLGGLLVAARRPTIERILGKVSRAVGAEVEIEIDALPRASGA